MDENILRTETVENKIFSLFKANKLPFLSGLISGLLAHMFAFTNLLPNHDCIESLFGKGATVTSGRWGLELVKVLFPDVSMPWIYGLISIVLISSAVCIMLKLLEIKSKTMQVLIPALWLGFPSLTGTFCFMFTSAPYALAFLFSVLTVYEFCNGEKLRLIIGILFTVAGLSIYQAYIAVSASLFMLIMIKKCLDAEESIKDIILFGIKAVLYMLCAVAVYYAVTILVLKFGAAEFNDYVTENVNEKASIPGRIKMAYDAFVYVFIYRNFYLVPTEFSRLLHIAYLTVLLLATALTAFETKKRLHAALCLLLVLLLPLGMNCMYLIMAGSSIHTLVLYSFVCVYVLSAIVCEKLSNRGVIIKAALTAMLGVFAVINIYFANTVYLKLDLELRNAESFYTQLLTRAQSTEGYDENSDLAIIGTQDNQLYISPELDTELLMGPPRELVNIYSREMFLKLFIGADIPLADEEALSVLEADPRYAEMPEYPFAGSIRNIDGHIVVKLG